MSRASTPPPPPTSTSTSNRPAASPLPNSPLAKRIKPAEAEPDSTNTSTPAMASTTTTTIDPSSSAAAAESDSLLVKLLSPTAKAPTRGSALSAGHDLYASQPATIPAGGKALVSTEISIACPAGTYGRIAPRSGLAAKHFIDTGAGVIDADYRGEVKVLLFNFGPTDFAVLPGDRIAQLVLERVLMAEVKVVAELEDSARGAGGFGSTGVSSAAAATTAAASK